MQEHNVIYDLLPKNQQELYDCIGETAYIKLVKRFGGDNVYVAEADSIFRPSRDEKIRSDYNGYNIRYLVNKYSLSSRRIRDITSDIRKEKQNAPLEGQLTFDDI